VVSWGQSAALSGTLTNNGAAFVGHTVNIQESAGGGAWTTKASPTTDASGSFSAAVSPAQATRYRVVFVGDAAHAACTSAPVTVTPKTKMGVIKAASKVKKGKSFTASGSLNPQMKAGSKTVKVQCYVKKHGKWTLKKTFNAKNANKGSASKYTAKVKLTAKGLWKLVAYSPETSQYAATTASATYVKVK